MINRGTKFKFRIAFAFTEWNLLIIALIKRMKFATQNYLAYVHINKYTFGPVYADKNTNVPSC